MKIFKFFAFMALCLVMASCGSSDKASEVASKISSGAQLTQADYTVMVDYCGQYAEAAQKLQDKIDVLAPTSEEAGKLTDEVASLTDKYKYVNEFFNKISSSTKEEVGEENVKKITELASLTWFTAPEWADALPENGVEGYIMDMPSSDSDSVIAVGDGEAVAAPVKQ